MGSWDRHLVLDGSIVLFESPSGNLPDSAITEGLVRLGRHHQVLCAGDPSHANAIAMDPDLGIDDFEQHFGYAGGALSIGSGSIADDGDGAEYWSLGSDGRRHQTRRWMAVWQGAFGSLHFDLQGHDLGARLLDIAQLLGIHDREDGLVVEDPDGRPLAWTKRPGAIKWSPEIGVVDSRPLTPESRKLLPPFTGTAVRGGELFKSTFQPTGQDHNQIRPANEIGTRWGDRDPNLSYFILVGESSVTYCVPPPGWLDRANQFAALLEDLKVAWDPLADSAPQGRRNVS